MPKLAFWPTRLQHNDDAILPLRSPIQLYIAFFIFSLLCSHYVADLIKELELRLIVILVLLKILACVRYFYQICTFSISDSPLKTMNDVFYFI